MKRCWERLHSKRRREKSTETGDASREPKSLKATALSCVSPTADTVGTNGLSAVHVVCASGQADCLESILKSRNKVKLNAHSRNTLIVKREFKQFKLGAETPWVVRWSSDCVGKGMTALHLAVVARSRDCVRLLLTQGAKANVIEGAFQETPLHYACLLGEMEIIRLLVDHGAKIDHCPSSGEAPIHYAITHSNKDCVSLLLERGANPNIRVTETRRELHFICRYPDFLWWLEESARWRQNKIGDAPLHYAGIRGQWETVDLLLQHGADAKQLGGMKCTPLHCAAKGGSTEAVRLLINENAPVGAFNDDGYTPLHLSVMRGHYGCAKLLLEHGADPNAIRSASKYADCPSPLISALGSKKQTADCVKLLVSKGADVDYRYKYQQRHLCSHCPQPLSYLSVFRTAIMYHHGPDILRLILASAADASSNFTDGNTFLMEACIGPFYVTAKTVKLLAFVKGMNLNRRDRKGGRTALHMCAQNGLTDAVRVLLDAGANPSVVNKEGLTPYDECNDEETRTVFQEYAG